jgi:transposase
VTHLQAEGAIFYIRVKAGDYVTSSTAPMVSAKVQSLKQKDATIALYGLTLRVIRSAKDGKNDEPWYILTNDMGSSRTKVVRIYYHRFEIEETFKDTKHLFELKRLQFQRPTSLKVVLWLVFLGIALLYAVTKPAKQHQHSANPKKWCSWIRAAYEQLQRELTQLRALTGLMPRYGDIV